MTMNYDEIAALVASGDWKEEILSENETATLTKNMNKFQYFTLEAYYVDGAGVESLCGRFFFSRDYINNWQIKDGNYMMKGNFGDGSKLVINNRTIDPNGPYTNLYIRKVHAYRPTRKTIYIYKVDPNTYLLTKDEEYLYTSEGLKIATADIAE